MRKPRSGVGDYYITDHKKRQILPRRRGIFRTGGPTVFCRGTVSRLPLQPQPLHGFLPHLVLQDLPRRVHGEGVHEIHVPGDLVLGHVGEDEVLHLLLGHGFALPEDDAGHDLLAVLLVGHADDLHVPDLWVGVDELLDLTGVDVLAAPDDHVLEPPGDLEIAVLVLAAEIAAVEPAVGVDGLGGGLGHLVVALHDVVAPGHELPADPDGALLPGVRVDDLALHVGEPAAHRLCAHVQGVVKAAHGAPRGRLCLAEHGDNLLHVHHVSGLAHQLRRAVGPGHDAGADVGEIRPGEILVVHHGDEHGGHAVEGGDPLLVDAGQGGLGGEVGQGAHGGPVGHGGGHGQYHAKAVEHGHLDHHPVCGGQIHVVPDILAVVDHVVVGEHDALGEAGGAGGVLHVGHVVEAHIGGPAADLLGGDPAGEGHGFLPGQAPGLPVAHGDDIAQEGQALAVERLPRLGGLKLGAELGDDLRVVAVPVALDHHQGVTPLYVV